MKLTSTAAGTGQMFEVDGTSGTWVGADDVGMVDIHSDGILVAGGNLLRVDSSGGNATNSHAVEIITSGTFQGSTTGTAIMRAATASIKQPIINNNIFKAIKNK